MENAPKDSIAGFNYLIAEKNKLLAITLVGPLSGGGQAQYDLCLNEVSKLDFVVAVISFREVTIIESHGLQFLANLQRLLRKKAPELGICGLSPFLREELTKSGVIRFAEIHNNLRDALIQLNAKAVSKKQAA
ncbi:MAG: STAS domain-containing protein [Pseudomonadota bacterium]|nr:STAS domain-containing protein [Pseudomonadota bacterium]